MLLISACGGGGGGNDSDGKTGDLSVSLTDSAGTYKAVSAQIFDADAQDEKDKVVIQAGTITDDDGLYSIFVMPGTFNSVAYKKVKNLNP